MKTLTAFFTAFFIVFLCTPIIRRIALYFKIVDIPEKRKMHTTPVPLLGGFAVYIGIIVTFLLFPESFRSIWPVLVGATVILYLGVLDDIRGLSAKIRIYVQLLVTAGVIGLGVRISFLPHSFLGDIAEFIITLIWIVGVTNAFNYLDGLDGLATGSVVINLFCFFIILYYLGQFALGLAAVIIMGACAGFLPHNFKNRSKMFLGDAGSTFLGFTVAGMAVSGDWATDNVVKLSIPILILGVPIFDMMFTTIMRIKEEKIKNVIEWLKYGGKDHFHHYLVDLGLSQNSAVLLIYYLTFSLGLGAIMLSNDTAMEGLLTVLQALIIFCVIGILIVNGKRQQQKKNS
ncbi:MAG: undecaprenyl/decaprenyl-phosphate alpha-N-acetylglucosaminyl 1-phosphate transferase [Candidatus Omnitrophica bacterium]|nr:undecaprenyl/decaprenyl-phosphate alpha-N-acetylglucosaminyl 1-phosphate transferase [Candidatus Omnitrophota bacterium]